ncbi:alpha/beta hydrolase [Sphingomonas sp. Leaf357]|uniref:hydrolase 1, exosortase A system-associated n=1 Tax=Sphingomonas sp. Leaf357 TaxID=1736350 RepID=UPI0006FD3011|nr:hydrolase 1, exosortase A system-associated [Sphingomonas sp. Leaf357]KQS01433.1 alpha/beta hydrolase [Sphingomonas sp. Leaf357]
MRKLIAFPCAGEMLVGTLDEGGHTSGLLIVSGGNEVRVGAHRGMALLAARLAAAGIPVFRYDRRGIGDSTGENTGFEHSADDMAAALATFRKEAPQVTRIVGFGNCDAATALALFHRKAGIDALVLANPWTIDQPDDLPPTAAIRARYVDRLKNPGTYLRLVRGGIDFRKLIKGLSKLSASQPQDAGSLAVRLKAAMETADKPVRIVLAKGDATAIAFAASGAAASLTAQTDALDTASHSFAHAGDKAALEAILRAALA